ncbi:MAG TPA: cell wall metabolism sensor histidine kinase WalK [Clostridiales bacterium]|nr:cell wall metabolism sensor histidine kinase WalK [Clostridiales bacterium]
MQTNRRIFSTLRWKIALAYLVVIGLGFLIINISIMEIFEKDMIKSKKLAMQKYAIEVAQQISNMYSEGDPDIIFEIQEIADDIAQKEGEFTRILILNNKGVVDYDSYNVIGPEGLLKRNLIEDIPEIKEVLEGHQIDAKDIYIPGDSNSFKRVMYAYAPITHDEEGIIGAVIISTSLSSTEKLLSRTRNMLNLYSAIISISIIIISFIISSFITKPLNELTQGIQKMSQGHLDQRVNITGSKELRQLGQAFNIMSEKLENLDKARNEFVSNASHELKTPLSSMKILTESLLHMDIDDPAIYNEFLTDIDNEIDRLNAIITDLLSLVHMDDGDIYIQKDEVVVKDLILKSIKGVQILAEKRDIELTTTFSDEELVVDGDEMKLQQVIINIVDNAIKYTPDGGKVWIEVYKGLDSAIIKVTDTGIGIPKEDIQKIFDRFFRVDKARSRSTGGTGLGLSIAHKIVLLHDGNIHVTSKEGKGTTFYIELPLKA